MLNHNALLGQVEGVDGVKTGYTEASGYNLVVSVRRNEKHIIAVVVGGTSNAMRNARMRELITRYMPAAVAGRKQSYVRRPGFEQEVGPVTPASATYRYRERGSCFLITRAALVVAQ